jgi:hypothetical protein
MSNHSGRPSSLPKCCLIQALLVHLRNHRLTHALVPAPLTHTQASPVLPHAHHTLRCTASEYATMCCHAYITSLIYGCVRSRLPPDYALQMAHFLRLQRRHT